MRSSYTRSSKDKAHFWYKSSSFLKGESIGIGFNSFNVVYYVI